MNNSDPSDTNTSDTTDISLQEEDHLIRSTKKIKGRKALEDRDMVTSVESGADLEPSLSIPVEIAMNDGTPPSIGTFPAGPKEKSFKDALAAPKSSDFYFDDTTDTISSDEGDADEDTPMPEDVQTGIPQIVLPKKLLHRIRQSWTNSLIVRLLGKSIGYRLLCTKVKNLWALQDEFNAIDLGSNYFLFKFSSQEDCAHVYSGGPSLRVEKSRARKPSNLSHRHGERGSSPTDSVHSQDGRRSLGVVDRARDRSHSPHGHHLVDQATTHEDRTRVEHNSRTISSLHSDGIHEVHRSGPSTDT
ncbi:hypothetical protein LOK49_LG13G02021 [Camellia lanceoleosa]|uniref:Uncharacterized protein n=1 Tax=Camellia lanceoleosa TaxID=1840588 RepID=A0ACC0FMJ3_9ERIC|nr:hypothetical protein LOK49_LG13G02021 [Camellia lanceoleosa]